MVPTLGTVLLGEEDPGGLPVGGGGPQRGGGGGAGQGGGGLRQPRPLSGHFPPAPTAPPALHTEFQFKNLKFIIFRLD